MTTNHENLPLTKPISNRHEPNEHGTTLVELIINCRPATYPVHGGHMLSAGLNRIRVPSIDVPAIMAQVEQEPELLVEAEKRYTKERDRYVAKELENFSTDPADRATKTRELLDQYPESVSSVFNREHDRTPLPLISVEVVQTGIPLPEEARAAEDKANAEERLAMLVGRSVVQALQAAGIAIPQPASATKKG